MRDLRYAVRTLVRNPGFTLTAAGSLALAIGGSVAVFTLLNAIVLRALPVQEPDRVFRALRVTSSETVGRHAWPAIARAQRVLAGQAEIAAATNMAVMQLQPPSRTGQGIEAPVPSVPCHERVVMPASFPPLYDDQST